MNLWNNKQQINTLVNQDSLRTFVGSTSSTAIKKWVQNLNEADTAFRRALIQKYDLPSNTFCSTLSDSNKEMGRVCVSNLTGRPYNHPQGGTAGPMEPLIKEGIVPNVGKECKVKNA